MSRCEYCKKFEDCKDSGFVSGYCGAYVPAREYVIVCNEHPSLVPGTLLFWGKRSENDAERSFGGYTSDVEKCERYTRAEIEKWRGSLRAQYPFYDEITPSEFYKKKEVVMTLKELEAAGFRKYTVMTR